MIGVKKMSPRNWVSSGCWDSTVSSFGVATNRTSFVIPLVASQSGNTDHEEPSALVHLQFLHMRLRPSATGFSMPGLCLMSMMLWLRIDSIHRLWWEFILSFRRQSRRA